MKKRTGARIMLSCSLPGLTRTHTTPRPTDETPVTGCMWRLTCGPPLPKTRCQLFRRSWIRLKSRRLVSPFTDAFTLQVWREMLPVLLGKPIARSKSKTRAFKKKVGYRREVDERDPETVCRETASESRKNSENPL